MTMNQVPTVAAVVVTYNRSAKLRKTIECILGQATRPDRVIIVDNASTDDTSAIVQQLAAEFPRIDYRRLDDNIGGAGGFSRGLRFAYESGCDLFWLMDDDCYADPDALRLLVERRREFIAATGAVPGFVCSLVKWHDEICEMNIPEPTWDWPRFFDFASRHMVLVKHCSFVSVLISRPAVKQVGLPIAEFFIWYDDVEYTKRLATSYPGLLVLDSLVHHDMPDNRGVNFGLITDDTAWKFCYGARNQAYFRKSRGGFFAWLDFYLDVTRKLRRDGVAPHLRRKMARALVAGLRMKVEIEHVED